MNVFATCWRMRWLVAAIIPPLAVLTPRPPQQLSISAALNLYQAGDWRHALEGLPARATTATQFTTALGAWINDAPSDSRRRLVAATFALDFVWAATRPSAHVHFADLPPDGIAPLDSRRSLGVIAGWVARQMPTAGPVTPTERALWLGTIGTAEEASAWGALQANVLPLARKRLPDEPRVRLAAVLAPANVDVGSLRLKVYETTLNLSVLREEHLPSSVTRRISDAIHSFQTLLTEASLAGEVDLRIGYLELRRRSFPEALSRFQRARTTTEDVFLRATADYLEGWVREQLGQFDQAVAAYRRALSQFPTTRNLATHLSALLFLRDDRVEAYAILDQALNARPIPTDLLTTFERGDGRFVGDWLTTARQGLGGASGS